MTRSLAARLAWGCCALSMCLVVASAVFVALNSFSLEIFYGWEPAIGITFPVVGALIVARQPQNRLGWLMCGMGLAIALDAACATYTAWAITLHPPPRGVRWIGWTSEWLWIAPFGALFTLVLLLFPTGRLPSRRWRPVAVIAAVAVSGATVALALTGGELADFPGYVNPLVGLHSSPVVRVVAAVTAAVAIGSALASLTALLLRLHRARGVERQQLKWFTFAGVISTVEMLVAIQTESHTALSTLLQFAAVSTLPIAIGIAILRYRLYEIDRIVSRTVSYTLVTGLLIAIYVAFVTSITRLTPTANSLAVAGSTLAVAALFQPVRRRVQAAVDRRFNRARYDADRTVESFSRRLRGETNVDAVRADLLGVVANTVEPAAGGLWLRDSSASAR